jgi:hypothetical protein
VAARITKSQASADPLATIGGVLGSKAALLPGESEDQYQSALDATIEELGAITPLQVYLAEKILECLWWIRRYEIQKRDTLVHAMAKELETPGAYGISEEFRYMMDALISNRLGEARFEALLKQSGHSIESLRQEAFRGSAGPISELDSRIDLKLKTLKGFQGSYEVLVNRKLHMERLRLQNDLLRRDLDAISVEVAELGSMP